jgi:formylglycine-generating enzyme required for sulfatase activity
MHDSDTLRLVGTTIDGKYHIDAIAGVGGAATVYRATHVTWGRTVAVKVIRNLGNMSQSARDEVLAKLVTEAELLASLSEKSPAIVQAYDIGTLTTGTGEWAPYLVLAWLSGATLEDVLYLEKEKEIAPRSLQAAITLLTPAANALALAHERGVAHRDVKPGNLFVTGAPRGGDASVKVLDFGIAKVVADAKSHEGFNSTIADLTSFTPAYGAPEQFSKALGATGPWTDVYGLALVLLEVALGREVAAGDDLGQLAYETTRASVRPTPRRLGIVVTDEVEAVMLKALAVKPSDRFPDVGAFWAALTEVAMPLVGMPSVSRISLLSAPASVRVVPSGMQHADTLVELPPITGHAPAATSASLPRGRKKWAVALGICGLTVIAGVGLASVNRGKVSSAAPLSPGSTAGPSTSAATSAAPPPMVCAEGMVLVPAGKFFMGSDDADAIPFEKPQHKVNLHAYCIDRTEVTVAAYRACSDAGGCKRAGLVNDWPGISSHEHQIYDGVCNATAPEERAKHPINCVDFGQAVNFCEEHGKRLPTEAEWELAARGPDGRRFPWGDQAPAPGLMNACGAECSRWGKSEKITLPAMFAGDDGWVHTAPVGTFPEGASRYGLLDVVGNVWEWVSDGFAPYTDAEAKDPTGKSDAPTRVIRGGAWNGSEVAWVRPTFRYGSAPTVRSHGIGFRCAADPK